MVPFTSTGALGYYLVSMFLTILGNILLSFPRCFLPRTQLPYDSNPVASGYVEESTCLSTCFRLVRIGFESQPTSLPSSSQSSLHAMNNKWHIKNQVEIEREYKTNSFFNVEEKYNEKIPEDSFTSLWLLIILFTQIPKWRRVRTKTKSVLNSISCLFGSITLSLKEELPMSYQSVGLILTSSQTVKNPKINHLVWKWTFK